MDSFNNTVLSPLDNIKLVVLDLTSWLGNNLMAVKLFFLGDNRNRNHTNEVPWHNTYNKESEVVGQEVNVSHISVCNTGLLLQSSHFKAYIFKGEKLYDLMLEALDYYVANPKESLPVMMVVTSSKQPNFGVEDSYEGDSIWKKKEATYYFTSPGTMFVDSSTNPFLPRTSTKKTARKGS